MRLTTVDLFRAGNRSGPRLDQLRPGEVQVQNRNGVDWVIGRSGGASTLDAPLALRGVWYRLPAGTPYDDGVLFLQNDYPGHWSWEPAHDMLRLTYEDALKNVNAEFVPV